MDRTASVGLFDSGVGGLTVWRELVRLLPNERYVYFADSQNAPYGERPTDEIIELARTNTQFLIEAGAKLVVVACNTATTQAIQYLRKEFPLPFIGIEPAFKPAAQQSKQKKVGILATRGTLNSTLFTQTYEKFGQDIATTIQVGKGLVELIEANRIESAEMDKLLREYLSPMIRDGVDHIVLGCTHYPFLREQIQALTPKHVEIVDASKPVALQAQYKLEELGKTNISRPTHPDQFFTNGDPGTLAQLIERSAPGRSYRITQL